MAVCNKDCFNCVYPDCINDKIEANAKRNSERRKECKRKRYYERKAAGVCVRCGKRPIAPSSAVHCFECLARSRNEAEKYRRRRGLNPRISFDGVTWCKLCGKHKPVEGKQLCADCLEASRKRIAYARTFVNKDKQYEEHRAFFTVNKSIKRAVK